jgi:hypothetical protein
MSILCEPFGPDYNVEGAGLQKFRRLARARELTREERRAYGEAVEKAVLAKQRSALFGALEPERKAPSSPNGRRRARPGRGTVTAPKTPRPCGLNKRRSSKPLPRPIAATGRPTNGRGSMRSPCSRSVLPSILRRPRDAPPLAPLIFPVRSLDGLPAPHGLASRPLRLVGNALRDHVAVPCHENSCL